MPMIFFFTRRCSRAIHILSLAALILLFFPSAPIRFATAAPASTPPAMWVTDGAVATTAVSGNTVYIGGGFNVVGPPTGGFGVVDQSTGRTARSLPNVDGFVQAMASDNTGGWYIGGTFAHVGGLERNNLAHILADGTIDPDWNPDARTTDSNPFHTVWALAVSNGAVYVGGEFTSIGGQPRRYLAAVDAVTGALTPWDIQTNSFVWALVAHGSTIYVGGPFQTIAGVARNSLAALDTATASVSSWDPKSSAGIAALALYDNTLYVTGGFTNIGGQGRNYIAAFDTQTGDVTSWNPNTSHTYLGFDFGLAVSDSTVYVGGQFDHIDGKARQNIVALDRITGDVTDWNPDTDGQVFAIAVSGNTVYASGLFKNSGGQPRYHLAALDATTGLATDWDPHIGWMDQYTNQNVIGMLFSTGTALYVGGAFTTIGGVTRNNLAALDATTGVVTDWDPNPDDEVLSLLVRDSTMYIGGNFLHIGGQARNRLTALDLSTDTITSWSAEADGRVYTLAASGSNLYIGGNFTTISGQPRSHIAAIDATTGTATNWHPDADNIVATLVVSGTTVYAGGYFTSIGGQSRNHLAALDTTTDTATSWNANLPSNPPYSSVETLAVRGNTVYAGGQFTSIGGQQRNGLAALDATTGNATSWKPVESMGFAGFVSVIAAQGPILYIGGIFKIDDQPYISLAALDADSGDRIPWDASVSGGGLDRNKPALLDLAVYGSTIYAGGIWRNAGTEVRSSFAAFSTVTPLVRTEPATDVNTTSVTLNGTVNAYTGSASVAFEYTTSSGDYTHAASIAAVPGAVTGASNTPVSASMSGLLPGTTYYYRVVATGEGGTALGNEQSFTTSAPTTSTPTPTAPITASPTPTTTATALPAPSQKFLLYLPLVRR